MSALFALPRERDKWATPQPFFDQVNAEFRFTLDVCALPESAKCERFYSPDDDGLKQPWTGRVWCNPPYSEIRAWMERGHHAVTSGQAECVVYLVPSRTGTDWFHEFALKHEVRFLRGRIKFVNAPSCAPFDCCLVVMRGAA